MILLIDESGFLFELLEETIGGMGVPLFRAKDIPSAKRKLLEASPKLVLSFTQIGNDDEAGYKFCKELQSHPSLSQVPVLLFSDELSDTALRRATDSGAKGIAPWPVSGESLKRRLGMLLPELAAVGPPIPAAAPAAAPVSAAPAPKPAPAAVPPAPLQPAAAPKPPNSLTPTAPSASAVAQSAATHSVTPPPPKPSPAPQPAKPAAPPAPGQHAVTPHAAAQPPTEFEKKLQIAQQILAKVLYDLKTSHLLQVVDFEDVPRVVSEVTRSVCNSGPTENKRAMVPSPVGLSNESSAGGSAASSPLSDSTTTSIDLDQIFGRKKE